MKPTRRTTLPTPPRVATVPPEVRADLGVWEQLCRPFLNDLKRIVFIAGIPTADVLTHVDFMARAWHDFKDLAALGYCGKCHKRVLFRQAGPNVVSWPCNHYTGRMRLATLHKWFRERHADMAPDRKASLLELLP